MKRIITCTDGTWDKPGEVDENGKSLDSNVCLLYNAIDETHEGIKQVKFYDTGVGTGYSLGDQLDGGITGAGIDKKIKDVYTFLMLNYEMGDHIYLFGFSRGAYTARSLAGFIRNCGILKAEHIGLVDKAFDLYRDRNEYTKPDSDMMRSFRRKFAIEEITPIKLIGVWDTVGALGIPLSAWKNEDLEEYKFHDITLSSTIEYAYQALAVDERRKPFEPCLWQLSQNKTTGKRTTELEQRWFAGVHCNVGGGYADRGLSDGTLKWMISKAAATGLLFNEEKLKEINPQPVSGALGNSFTWQYWLSGKVWRKVLDPAYADHVIDDSVVQRIEGDKSYRPKNLKGIYSDIW